jgi:hypothetical protein
MIFPFLLFLFGLILILIGFYLLYKIKEDKKEYVWVGEEGEF